jgi:hypothetical protein
MVEETNSYMIYLIHCKNLCKCYSVPPSITTIRKKKEKHVQMSKITLKILNEVIQTKKK